MYATKRYPLEVHIGNDIIEKGRGMIGKNAATLEEADSTLNLMRYPYTNEDLNELEKAFKVKGPDGKVLIRDKKSMLFIAGGGAILGIMDSILANNPLDRLVGIDISSAQLCNFKYLARRAASEEKRGRRSFLRRSPSSSNTTANAINIVYKKQEIDEKLFGYSIAIKPEIGGRSYFQIPAKGLQASKHDIELVKEDIAKYLRDVERDKAPDLIYISNLSEWSEGKIYEAMLNTIKSEDKFALGTTIIGMHLSKAFIAVKVLKDGKPDIEMY